MQGGRRAAGTHDLDRRRDRRRGSERHGDGGRLRDQEGRRARDADDAWSGVRESNHEQQAKQHEATRLDCHGLGLSTRPR